MDAYDTAGPVRLQTPSPSTSPTWTARLRWPPRTTTCVVGQCRSASRWNGSDPDAGTTLRYGATGLPAGADAGPGERHRHLDARARARSAPTRRSSPSRTACSRPSRSRRVLTRVDHPAAAGACGSSSRPPSPACRVRPVIVHPVASGLAAISRPSRCYVDGVATAARCQRPGHDHAPLRRARSSLLAVRDGRRRCDQQQATPDAQDARTRQTPVGAGRRGSPRRPRARSSVTVSDGVAGHGRRQQPRQLDVADRLRRRRHRRHVHHAWPRAAHQVERHARDP